MVQNVLFLVLEIALVSAMVRHTLDVQVALLAHPVLLDNIVLTLVSNNVAPVQLQTQQVVILATIALIVVLQDTRHLQLLVVRDIILIQKLHLRQIHHAHPKLAASVRVVIIAALLDIQHLQLLVGQDIH